MQRIIIVIAAAGMLVASGAVHGVWTDRWSEQTDLKAAASKLERLPMTIGSWQGANVEMQNDPSSSVAGQLARRYVHDKTGKAVTILLTCGRAGAVCTHTPDVCYAGNGYEVEKPKRYQASEPKAEFWTARFVRERASGKSHLRIFWAWHGTQSWKVADNPRWTFAGEKVLFKLYLINELVQSDEPPEASASVEFMHDLLPAIKTEVVN
ncbi:MAG TPA: exosortase-associated EpsI family protein [Gemmataceae bacterium]|nr:exosortase-associated EpsI family protein [Gemmataceae bacterium]